MNHMKPFARKLLALGSAAAIFMSVIPAVHAVDAEPEAPAIAEQWASVHTPAMKELVPARVRTISTDAPLTRRDLCGMSMNVYKSLTGQTDEDLGEPQRVFIDSYDRDVLNAYALELVTAENNGFFSPAETVSRQDFFTSSVQLLDTLGYSYIDDIDLDLSGYSDADELMSYAVQPAKVLLAIGALEDTQSLRPTRQITAEEAVVIMDRLMSFFSDWQENPVEPQRYLGEEVAELALTKVGCRYVSGGHGPSKFDCSGLVYWAYKQFGYDLKPGARNQWSLLGKSVKKADLLPGDLLFFSNNGSSSGIFHVGIYIGGGEFVHAANSRKGVIVTGIDEAWYANRYLGAKRAIN